MKKILGHFVAAALLLFAFAPAYGQQVPLNSLPVGRGVGATGFKSVGPCADGQVVTWASGAPVCVAQTAGGVITYPCALNAMTDTPGLQAAINAAQTLSPAGGTMRFSGRCAINAALTITSNVTVEGDAMNSTFLYPTSNSISCINFAPSGEFKSLNLRDFTCSYATLTSSGATGFQFGSASYNNIAGIVERVNCTNCTQGIYFLNTLNTVMEQSSIGPFYYYGVKVASPLSPDAGGVIMSNNYIETFAPLTTGNIGVYWESGGALNIHDNQIFASNPVWLHANLQTSELHVHHNLMTGTGTSTSHIRVEADSATFTCSQTGTTLTVSGVAGLIVPSAIGAGQTVFGSGVPLGDILVSQISGTTGGAGTYTMNQSATVASTACRSTFLLTELNIDGNILDNAARALYVPSNIGGSWMENLSFTNNQISSNNNASTNEITVYHTFGLTLSGNTIKCNGTCSAGRPIYVDSTVDKATIWQPRSAEPGAWGAADIVSSTNTCGMTGNALLTGC